MENSKNVKNGYLKISKKIQFCEFQSIDWEFFSIDRMFLFDWSKRNREPIDSGRNFMMKFFIVSIDREFLTINQMLFSINRTRIENQSNELVALWWIS